MTCPHCGADVMAGYTFCPRCRKRVIPPGTSPAAPPAGEASPYAPPTSAAYAPRRAHGGGGADEALMARPGAVTFMAVVDTVLAALGLLVTMAVLFVVVNGGGGQSGEMIFAACFYGFGSLFTLLTAIGLFRMQGYARILKLVISGFGLLALPCGTVVSVLVLIYLLKPGVALLFSGRSAQSLTPQEVAQVQAARGSGALVFVAYSLVLSLFLFIPIIAAIAIPSLLRARVSANEAASISELREVVSAQASYSGANASLYSPLACLSAPASCIPGYSANSPYFLDARFANPIRHGYRFELHLGPAPESLDPSVSASASSMTYAYVAVPVAQNRSGVRSFCANETGVICSWQGAAPPIVDGACPQLCEPIR
jgi:hypothetical protein